MLLSSIKVVSDSERRFIIDGVEQGLRSDGRHLFEHRILSVDCGGDSREVIAGVYADSADFEDLYLANTSDQKSEISAQFNQQYQVVETVSSNSDIIPSANGSARVSTQDTDIVVAVKAELSVQTGFGGEVLVHVDCSAIVGPEFDNRVADELGYWLSASIQEKCFNADCIDKKLLCIKDTQFAWTVHIDISVLIAGGCLLDTITVAMRAALMNTLIPGVEIFEQGEPESSDAAAIGTKCKILADERECAGIAFPVSRIPVCVSVGQISQRYLWDMTSEEEACSDVILSVFVQSDGTCVGLSKSGDTAIDIAAIPNIIQNSQRKGNALIKRMTDAFKRMRKQNDHAGGTIGFLND